MLVLDHKRRKTFIVSPPGEHGKKQEPSSSFGYSVDQCEVRNTSKKGRRRSSIYKTNRTRFFEKAPFHFTQLRSLEFTENIAHDERFLNKIEVKMNFRGYLLTRI